MWEVMIARCLRDHAKHDCVGWADESIYDQEFLHVHHQIRDREAHIQLQYDLVEHMWINQGNH